MPKGNLPDKIKPITGIERKSARISIADAESIAKLVAKGHNKSEACALLGIIRDSWFNWKCINKSRCEDIFTRIKAEKVGRLLESVEVATVGGDDAKGRPIRADWRAGQWLLSVAAPERFSTKQDVQSQAPVVNVQVITELSKLVFPDSSSAATIDCPPLETKALAYNPTASDAPNG